MPEGIVKKGDRYEYVTSVESQNSSDVIYEFDSKSGHKNFRPFKFGSKINWWHDKMNRSEKLQLFYMDEVLISDNLKNFKEAETKLNEWNSYSEEKFNGLYIKSLRNKITKLESEVKLNQDGYKKIDKQNRKYKDLINKLIMEGSEIVKE